MSEKYESELEPDDDLDEDSTRWTCRGCGAWVALGDGLSVPQHGLCHVCASSRVDELNEQLAEVTAERDALKWRVEELEDGYTRGLLDARTAYAQVWCDVARQPLESVEFTTERFHVLLRGLLTYDRESVL